MRTLKIILTLAILTSLTSCDCLQNVTGTVLDAETNKPIANANVQKKNKEHDKDITNEKGEFEIESISGGLFGCPPMTIVITKDGYETKNVEIDNAENEIIRLQKILD